MCLVEPLLPAVTRCCCNFASPGPCQEGQRHAVQTHHMICRRRWRWDDCTSLSQVLYGSMSRSPKQLVVVTARPVAEQLTNGHGCCRIFAADRQQHLHPAGICQLCPDGRPAVCSNGVKGGQCAAHRTFWRETSSSSLCLLGCP